MKHLHTLDNTTIEVPGIGLGAMPLSLANHPDEQAAFNVIDAFIDAGGRFIDTANVYCTDDHNVGHNERLLARALNRRNDNEYILIATKGGLRRPKGDWTVDASPEWLRQSCEQSLRDLEIDSHFLYQLHAPDPKVPLTESVGELARLQSEGKIQHIGLSNVDVEQIRLALSVTSIMSVQNRCNVFQRQAFTNGVIDFCAQSQISFIAHSPVGGHFQHRELSADTTLVDIAAAHAATPYQVMLVWLLMKNTAIMAIPGASRVQSIIDSMAALELELTTEEIARIDQLA